MKDMLTMKKLIMLGCMLLPVIARADWSMFRHDSYRTGFSDETGALDSVRLRWDWSLPSMVPCMRMTSPAIGDIDGDDTMEIVLGASLNGTVYALKDSVEHLPTGRGYDTLIYRARVLWQYKVSSKVESSPLLSDINNDSILEVIFGSYNDSLYALDGSGNRIWSFGTGGSINSSPVAGDIDIDGNVEIAFGSWDSYVYVLDANGTLKWKYKTGNRIESSPALADINKDGTLEIVIGSEDKKLYCFQPSIDTLETLWVYTASDKICSTPAIGDLDKDGTLDVVFGCVDGMFYAINGAIHDLLWYFSTVGTGNSDQCQSVGLADIDNDGKLEVVAGSFAGGGVYALEGETGMEKWELTYFGWPVPSSPAIADIDGDGSLEIVMSIHDGYCYAWNSNGNEQWVWGYSNGDQDCPPALGDIDCDGMLEIVGSDIAKGKFFVLDFPLPDTFPIGIEEKPGTKFYGDILRVSQNPIISSIIIKYYVPAKSNVLLSIYDITGKKVAKLVNEAQEVGSYDVNFSTISKVSTGIYFVRLEVDRYKETRKIILIK